MTKLGKANYIRLNKEHTEKITMATSKSDNLSASLEDYLEAIFNLSSESNIARSKDIAKSLDVSRASVTGALRVLKQKGLANYKPYDYVTLTDTGRATAAEIAKKHKILQTFSSTSLVSRRKQPKKPLVRQSTRLDRESSQSCYVLSNL